MRKDILLTCNGNEASYSQNILYDFRYTLTRRNTKVHEN
jgi:hypothetical protein